VGDGRNCTEKEILAGNSKTIVFETENPVMNL
jgi:hypothetical protein